MPITCGLFLIGSLANSGIFPLSGFWSKDEILVSLEHAHENVVLVTMMVWVFISGIYGARLFILTFLGQPKDRHAVEHAHEPGPAMLVPMILLGILAVVSGFVIFPEVAGWIGFPGFLEFVYLEEPEEFHFNVPIAVASSISAALGILLAWWFWGADPERAERAKTWAPGLYTLLREKYYLDDLYQGAIDRVVLTFSRAVAWFDRNVVNDTGVDGAGAMTSYAGYILKFHQTGKLPNYALITIVGVIAIAVAGILART
jgi:NADH-quinone oxidoreductase subunit L